MTKNSSFSVIVPAFNEEQTIKDTVSEIHMAFSRVGHDFEILIVNDGSTDFTAEIINTLGNDIAEVFPIHLNRNYLNDTPAYKRNINTVFQNYALFPHLTVGRNVAFGRTHGTE